MTSKNNKSTTTGNSSKNVGITDIDERLLISLKEVCKLTGWGITKARKVVKRPKNGFTVKLGNKYFVHKELFDEYLRRCAKYNITV